MVIQTQFEFSPEKILLILLLNVQFYERMVNGF